MIRYAVLCSAIGAAILIGRHPNDPPAVALVGYAALAAGLVCGVVAAYRSGWLDDERPVLPRDRFAAMNRTYPNGYRTGGRPR